MTVAHWHGTHWLGPSSTGGGGTALAEPVLSIVDNADGTGAVATVASATTGTTNTLYVQRVDGELASGTWTSKGGRVGNGTIAASITTLGLYWGKVESVLTPDSITSNLVYFAVTDATEAVHYQCLTATRDRIQSLALSGVVNASVVVKKLPLERIFRDVSGIALPCVLVTPIRPTMNPTAGVNSLDDVVYGVLVTLVAKDNQESTYVADLDKYTKWLEKIAKAFRNQRLPGASTVIAASVEPADVVIPAAWANQLWASALTIRFTSREARGL